MEFTFGLLGLAICAVWIRPIRTEKFYLRPWLLLFVAACLSGFLFGYLKYIGIAAIIVFTSTAYFASKKDANRLQKIIFGTITAVLALALAMHQVPGFDNPIILPISQLSLDAVFFTQYANFDKGTVGLIILVFFCNRTNSIAEFLHVLKKTIPIAIASILLVIVAAMAMNFIQPDLKFNRSTLIFLVINLLFTVVAEESFFRGFLQNRFAMLFHKYRYGGYYSIAMSSTLFGIAHIGGGLTYFILAIIGGIGYACAFFLCRRIEAPIFVHFAFNAVHFIGFTYPHLN